ncbi:hypothetical protein D9611_011279 [Ephemerocybe angulata]|uniref:Reverse transcriptase n=1 Tax=Ephemerocybe angulata TaxID=980116 RepID=A0A8H5F1X5_9AGAR|nr:hypothetical protein D9611_011279 [Tulosesus angulatus]
MFDQDFRGDIRKYDINIFQETHVYEGGMGAIADVPGYEMFSVERKYKEVFVNQQWGGVVVVARAELGLTVDRELTSTDILVLQADQLVIVAAYILPEGSDWRNFTEVDPFEKLLEVLAVVGGRGRPVLVCGDLNARTAGEGGGAGGVGVSQDGTKTTRGNALLGACEDGGYSILNGLPKYGEESGRWTSHHTRGKAVIDYFIGDAEAGELVEGLEVKANDPRRSDHSEVVARVKWGKRVGGGDGEKRRKGGRRRKTAYRLPTATALDRLVIRAVASIPGPEEQLRRLYGQATCETAQPEMVYVDGSCIGNGTDGARAGAGVFFGPGCRRNIAARVPDGQSNSRAEAYAILLALRACDERHSLVICSDSETSIKMLTEWAPGKAAIGWRVEHGDLFGDIADLLRRRSAPVTFRKVKAHSGNKHNDGADELAKQGAGLPAVPPYEVMRGRGDGGRGGGGSIGRVVPGDKVKLDMREARRAAGAGGKTVGDEEGHAALTAAHERWQRKQEELRRELFEARTEMRFWTVLKKLLGEKAAVCGAFTADELMAIFVQRMNMQDPLPDTFDTRRLFLNQAVAATIDDVTEDETMSRVFSREWGMGEIEKAKKRLLPKLAAATGEDEISYEEIFKMDNEVLLELCNECIRSGEIPSTWVRTKLIGLCKRGKPKDDPKNYRTIGLESCLLKFMTLLINGRLVEWAEERKLIPPSQNGFRAGYRTNNNVFVLRCAEDKARAEKKPLYAAFVDMTNAFPSTEQSTLWLKMRNWGQEGQCLIGSGSSTATCHTCSPILWALFMADLPDLIPADDADIVLDGVAMGSLEQADDILLLSTTPEGLQRKMDGIVRWCAVNFLEINCTKSVVMVLGRRGGVEAPEVRFGGRVAEVVAEQPYLGFVISSEEVTMLRGHYKTKVGKAQKVGRAVCALEQLTGVFPAERALRLYMALVDPHLTHGCDIALDNHAGSLRLLERVQISYLRRVLGLGKRSMIPVLFSETGIVPVRYRRLLIALGYLRYLAVDCTGDQYARRALNEAIAIDFAGRARSWITELREVVGKLPFPCPFPAHADITNAREIDALARRVEEGMKADVQAAIDGSDKTYLLHDRVERGKEGRSHQLVLGRRPYLKLGDPAHRRALTRVLLSNHKMGVELLRYTRPTTPRQQRLCRFCRRKVETPEHLWLECRANAEVCNLREEFVADVMRIGTNEETAYLRGLGTDWVAQMKALTVGMPGVVAVVARYTYQVEQLIDKYPLYRP